jgi:hypothetical protein
MGTFGTSKYLSSEVYLKGLPTGSHPDTIQTLDVRNKLGALDVTATLLAMAEKIEELEQRIANLED